MAVISATLLPCVLTCVLISLVSKALWVLTPLSHLCSRKAQDKKKSTILPSLSLCVSNIPQTAPQIRYLQHFHHECWLKS